MLSGVSIIIYNIKKKYTYNNKESAKNNMLNKVTLMGHTGTEPKLYDMPSGGKKVYFRFATTYKERTDWHDIVCFGKLAEVVSSMVHKGSLIYIEGRLNYYTPEGKDETARRTEIVANSVVFIRLKKENSDEATAAMDAMPEPSPHKNTDDIVPF